MHSVDTSKPRTTSLDRWSFAGALLLTAYYLVTTLYISSHRLFWFDEVLTTLTIRMPNWHAIWSALIDDARDQTPVGYFVVARTFDELFGPSEIGIRLPSALAMIAGMWITYDSVRRVTDRLHGLIAMAVLTCSFLPYYGYDGRSYALYFLFASAALWAWIGKRSAILLALAFFCGVAIHYYFVLCLLPMAAEEAYHWRPWRRPSARIVGAVVGSVAGLVVLLPQIFAARHWIADFWSVPVGRQVPSVYTDFFSAGLFLLAMVTLWVVLNDRSEAVVVKPVLPAERTGWFALAIPIAAYILAKLVTHAYVDRYLIGMLPGVAIGFACLLWRRFPGMPRISVGILLLLAAYGLVNQAFAVRHPDEIEAYGPIQQRTKAILAMEERIWSSGARYIVIDTQDHLFVVARYYSKHPERYIWWAHLRTSPRVFRHYANQYWTLNDARQHAREAVFVDLETEKLAALQQAGIHTVVRQVDWLALTYPE